LAIDTPILAAMAGLARMVAVAKAIRIRFIFNSLRYGARSRRLDFRMPDFGLLFSRPCHGVEDLAECQRSPSAGSSRYRYKHSKYAKI
jgi:hypothetical protein